MNRSSEEENNFAPKTQFIRNAFERTRFTSERSAKILETVQPFFDHVDTGGVTESDGSVVTEGSSRNDCHVCFTQQPIGEVLGSQTKLADIHKHVKCTLWFHCGNVGNLREAIKHVIATHVEFFPHVDHRLLIALKGGECAIL